ncbi:hypothetical protein BaRGS_00034500 [Batillaria attramentaria]|uniref:Apple domain-containing protein n=1 Tax=Batillaria attramentaria TaxID=370345 RepID=A0ABD0JIL6_9CAEN
MSSLKALTTYLLWLMTSNVHANSATSSWHLHATRDVIDSEAVTSARSRIDCARLCRQHSHCILWAFDKLTGTCYLHPTDGDVAVGGVDIKWYMDEAPLCSESEAPIVTTNVTWERTLTSLESVTPVEPVCPTDYIGTVQLARCSATGVWETGECKQRIWRNVTPSSVKAYPVPRVPAVGWSACLTATPIADSQ